MRRLVAAIVACLAVGVTLSARQTAVLKIAVTIVDADQRVRPVPRHALLISDNPATAAPRRVVTALDGTAEIHLRPGNYTVESDEPLIFQGKSYEWAETLDVRADRTTVLELTAAKARTEAAAGAAATSGMASEASVSAVLVDWQNSIVPLWTPTQQAAGFVIDARGLIATNQRVVGSASTVEVQLSPTEKYPARVVAADASKNVAILWIDPATIRAVRPVTLAAADAKPVAENDRVFAIQPSTHAARNFNSGTVRKTTAHAIESDISVDHDSAGAPLFNAAGDVVAITTSRDEKADREDVTTRAVRIDEARSVIAAAAKALENGAPPAAARLPVEPERPYPEEALREAIRARGGSLSAYQVPAADFDVSVITPLLVFGAQHGIDRATERERGAAPRNPAELPPGLAALEDFGNWSDYVSDYPPVVMIRATPKLVEGFWTTVARGAAQTQGVGLPAMKHIKASFASLRLTCGATEVTPIHPFRIERRINDTTVAYEGLYVFAPDAIGPQCDTVKLTLFSEKDPEKGDTRIVDPRIVEQIRLDFTSYR